MRAVPLAFFVVCVLLSPLASAEELIVLQDLSAIRAISVTKVDEDGLVVATSGGESRTVRWDDIFKVQLSDETQQTQAEKLKSSLGEPLLKLRVRLETGDDVGLLEPAESLAATFQDRSSGTAYVVLQSLVFGRIATGEREKAVAPWLRSYGLLRTRAAKLSELSGTRRPQIDASTALLFELLPVWFDAEAAKTALPEAQEALKTLADPAPAGAVYYVASLALAAGERDTATALLQREYPEGSLAERLRQVLLAQAEVLDDNPAAAVTRLQRLLGSKAKDENAWSRLEPLALYWLGQAQLASEDESTQRAGLLTLMRIPALYGKQSPDLAGAALHRVAEAYADDATLANRLRKEIRSRFAGSWHALHK